jgi:hypothetical protein
MPGEESVMNGTDVLRLALQATRTARPQLLCCNAWYSVDLINDPDTCCPRCGRGDTLTLDRRCQLASSEARALVLVELAETLPDHDARTLISTWWTMCDGVAADVSARLYQRLVQLDWTADTMHRRPTALREIYRAHIEATDPLRGMSWTTSLQTAHQYVEYLRSPRARLMGVPDGEPVITRAACDRFVARFLKRGEHEVIPDKSRVILLRYRS